MSEVNQNKSKYHMVESKNTQLRTEILISDASINLLYMKFPKYNTYIDLENKCEVSMAEVSIENI